MESTFTQLHYSDQLKRLLAASDVAGIQKAMDLKDTDAAAVSHHVVNWLENVSRFDQNLEFGGLYHLYRKFKRLLNKDFAAKISEIFQVCLWDPSEDIRLDYTAFSKKAAAYFKWIILNSFYDDEHVTFLNEKLTAWPDLFKDFEATEALLMITGGLGSQKQREGFHPCLEKKNLEERRQYLINLKRLCLWSSSTFGENNQQLLQHFFDLSVTQQEDVLNRLLPKLEVLEPDVRIFIIKAYACFGEGDLSLVHDALAKLMLNQHSYIMGEVIKHIDDLPEEKRLLIISRILPVLDNCISRTGELLIPFIDSFSCDHIPEVIALLTRLTEKVNKISWCNFLDSFKRLPFSEESKVEALALLANFRTLLAEDDERASNILERFIDQAPEQVSRTNRLLETYREAITDYTQLKVLVVRVALFPPAEQAEVLPLLLPIAGKSKLEKYLSSLSAFPIGERREIFLKAYPYLIEMESVQEIDDCILSVGLGRGDAHIEGTAPSAIISSAAVARPSFITLEKLRAEGTVNISLEGYIARYLGEENNPAAMRAARRWIEQYAKNVFHNPVLFFREITANGFDAQLSWEKQVGNFGVGFYSLFSLFFQTQNRASRIELTTSYWEKGVLHTYMMTFHADDEQRIHIQWKLIKVQPKPIKGTKDSGTKIAIYPEKGTQFSIYFLNSLKETLKEFRFFKHGFVYVNDRTVFGNVKSNNCVNVTLDSDRISVEEEGCGIPIENCHLLLVPSISNKRRSVEVAGVAMTTPEVRFEPSELQHSSLIITNNGVVNSIFPLQRSFETPSQYYDLVIEFPKCFKPTINRGGIQVPGTSSAQAEAVCRMIDNSVEYAFRMNSQNKILLTALHEALQAWESYGLQADLKGYFTSHLQSALRRKLSENPNLIPCPDNSLAASLNACLFASGATKFIPLPRSIIPEGYLAYELMLVKQYRKWMGTKAFSYPQELLIGRAAHREMIEGLSVLFIEDELLKDKGSEARVTCGPFSGILLAPFSLLKGEAPFEEATFGSVQRRICQRFADPGKRIAAAGFAAASPLTLSTIFIPQMKQATLKRLSDWREAPFFHTYLATVDSLLDAPLIQSLDVHACGYYFWKICERLNWSLCGSWWDNGIDRSLSFTRGVFEVANSGDGRLFGLKTEHFDATVWKSWFEKSIFIDPSNQKTYRLAPGSNVDEICEEFLLYREIVKKKHLKDGEILEGLLEKFPHYIEEVPADELFKRLCLLLLIFWGIDPKEEELRKCYVGEKEATIDFTVLVKGMESWLVEKGQTETIIYGGGKHLSSPLEHKTAVAPFAPLLENLKIYLDPSMKHLIFSSLINVLLFRESIPEYCQSFADQLLEMYQRYLTIPAHEFPREYGSNHKLSISVEESRYGVHDAAAMIRHIPQKLAVKLLQEVIGEFSGLMNVSKRTKYLQKGSLKITPLTRVGALIYLTKIYTAHRECLPLINSVLSLGDTYEETTALALILHHANKNHPRFFELPPSYQHESLSLILQQFLRKEGDLQKKIKNGEDEMHLSSLIKTGIDCIGLFTERYETIREPGIDLIRKPEDLFNQVGMTIFYFPQLMDAVFTHQGMVSALATGRVDAVTDCIAETPAGGQFVNFGMLTHASALKGGRTPWQIPLIEMLKNSLEACNKLQDPSNEKFDLNVNFGIIPYDQQTSQFVYEVSDPSGFENLEALISLLIPGYQARDSRQLGLGFFRMLSDVSIVHYKTRLRSHPEVLISLIVKPIRDDRGEIVNLKIGIKTHESDPAFQGTMGKVYLIPQLNIDAQIRLKQANHFVEEVMEKTLPEQYHHVTYFGQYNGCVVDRKYRVHGRLFYGADIDPPMKGIFGKISDYNSKKPSVLLIDGIPQQISLSSFFEENNLLNTPSEVGGNAFLNFPSEFFVPLLDASSPVLKEEVRPLVEKFVMDWLYLHLRGHSGRRIAEKILPHYKLSDGNIPQLIITPCERVDKPKWVAERMLESSDYEGFFTQYSLAGHAEIDGVVQRVRVPSFAEYLYQVYRELYPQWIECVKRGKYSLSPPLGEWIQQKKKAYECLPKDSIFRVWNNELLDHINKWYGKKCDYISYHVSARNKDAGPAVEESNRRPIEKLMNEDPSWIKVKEFVEDVLAFYANTVLERHVSVPNVRVELCYNEAYSAGYQPVSKKIMINLEHLRPPVVLRLLAALDNKEVDAHYVGGILHSEVPSDSGILNHEVYHALCHLLGKAEEHSGHQTKGGMHFEARARAMADEARRGDVLAKLEGKIRASLEAKGWTAASLVAFEEQARALEKPQPIA